MIRLLFFSVALTLITSIYDFKVEGLDGGSFRLEKYKGKKCSL